MMKSSPLASPGKVLRLSILHDALIDPICSQYFGWHPPLLLFPSVHLVVTKTPGPYRLLLSGERYESALLEVQKTDLQLQ